MNISAFTKTYGTRTVLSFPKFPLKKGTVYAVIGANGCGKSTLAKVLSEVILSDTGKPVLSDRLSVGYLPQKPYVFHMTLKKNLMINSCGNKAKDALLAEERIKALGLDALKDKPAATLSGGETAKMALGRLLMRDYELLILDEPCAAMDIPSTLQAEALIRETCSRTDCTVILITHSLLQAKRLADEVLFLSEGRLCESGPTEQVLNAPVQAETGQYLQFASF